MTVMDVRSDGDHRVFGVWTVRRDGAQPKKPGRRADGGAATVWVLAVGLVTVLMAIGSAMIGAAVVARHRAQSAADLAALAGALRAVEGESVACVQADRIASAHDTRLIACQLDGWDVVVTVVARPARVVSFAGLARASARAGPADS